jgi:4'-phosphopantetheinyl transferase
VDVYLAHLPEYEGIHLPLSTSEKADYDQIKSAKRRSEWRVSRWLRRYILSQKLDILPEYLRFETTKKGRPFIENIEEIDFNISHSGNWLAMIVSGDNVGIDIQVCQPKRNLLGIAKQYFLRQEYEALLKERDPSALFYQLWTLKEACVKATGEGIASGFPKYGFKICHDKIVNLSSRQPFSLRSYVFEEMLLSVASKHEQVKIRTQQIFPDGKKKVYALKQLAST